MHKTFQDNSSLKKFTLKKFLLLVSLILSFIFGIVFQSVFQITHINTNLKDAKTKFQYLLGKNIVFLATEKEEKLLQKSNPSWETVSITKKFPNTLQVSISKEQAFAQIQNKNRYLIVNRHGKILALKHSVDKKLISISYFQTLRDYESKVNNTLTHKEIQYALKSIELGKNYSLKIKKITINKPQTITLYLSEDFLAILNVQKPIAKNLFILQNIIKSLEIKGIKPKIINLEFDKPTITL